MPRRTILVALTLAALGCTESVDGGQCVVDADCGGNQTCLFDIDRATTYCTSFCENDGDCPTYQDCRTGKREGAITEMTPLKYCVDRIRGCQDVEKCNGFDDDCDGVIDEEGCEIITNCLDDRACDAWTCQAPVGQPTAVCAPPNDQATRDDFETCMADDECKNGLCDTGFCSPLCRPLEPCPAFVVDGTRMDTACVGAVGRGETRPKHNECQILCNSPSDCTTEGQQCVWRQVYQDEPFHAFVCSWVNDSLLPLGAECPNNEPDGGDAMCQSGLCFQKRCTRPCDAFSGTACRDVAGAGVECTDKRLIYGVFELGVNICAVP